jgi:hypothetical protein
MKRDNKKVNDVHLTKRKVQIAKFFLAFALLFTAQWAFAYGGGLGDISRNALVPLDFLRHIFNIASILLGVFLLLNALMRYFRHRQNPHEAPLSTVIVLALCGILLIVIPVAYRLSQQATTKAAVHGIYN